MARMYFYDRLDEMECLAGDTLPCFVVGVETAEGETLDGCTMQLLLAPWDEPERAAVSKTCTATEDGKGFAVTLTSTDTAGLAGVFRLHFCLTNAAGLHQRKLAGVLTVRACVQGGAV